MNADKIREDISNILNNVRQNAAQVENQIAQGEQQMSLLAHQRDSIKTLIAALEHGLESGVEHAEAILKRLFSNEAAAAQVANSPSQPAAGQADAPAAGAPQG